MSKLNVVYAAQNYTTVPINTIHISLQQNVCCYAQGHFENHNKTISEKTIEVDSKNGILKSLNKQILLDATVKQESLRTIKEMIESGDNFCELDIGQCENYSHKGTLIFINHFVQIRLNTPQCSANPFVNANINIMRISGQIEQPPVRPIETPVAQNNLNNENWQPTIASVYTAPIATKNGYDNTSKNKNEGSNQIFPESPDNSNSIYALSVDLTNSFDNLSTVEDWLSKNDANKFQANDFLALFRVINSKCSSYIQRSITVSIANKLQSITCESIAAAARSCDEADRRDVIEILAKDTKVSDKQNKDLIKGLLSDFQFMCVEKYFN
jgi:hypothetical protein